MLGPGRRAPRPSPVGVLTRVPRHDSVVEQLNSAQRRSGVDARTYARCRNEKVVAIRRAEAFTAKSRATQAPVDRFGAAGSERIRAVGRVTHGEAERMSMNTVRVSGVDACIRRPGWLER
jgi:hypothetical protein